MYCPLCYSSPFCQKSLYGHLVSLHAVPREAALAAAGPAKRVEPGVRWKGEQRPVNTQGYQLGSGQYYQ